MTRSTRGDPRPSRFLLGLGIGLLAGLPVLLSLVPGCSEELPPKPSEEPSNIILARYVSEEEFEEGVICLDGERKDLEWGSEFSPNRPFYYVRVSPEFGHGNPGGPRYVSMKALYTYDEEEENGFLYLLVQWYDPVPEELADAFFFRGPNLDGPIVTCVDVGGETVCDTMYRSGEEDSLMLPDWWVQFGDDDKIAFAFEMDQVEYQGVDFRTNGCLSLCHEGEAPQFGTITGGGLDVWYWLAGRTNPVPNLFSLDDDPSDPKQGVPGYLDDMYADRLGGIVPDPGLPCYWSNRRPAPDGNGSLPVPHFVYRVADDLLYNGGEDCENRWGGDCGQNNYLPFYYLWRERPGQPIEPFSPADTLNEAAKPNPRKWHYGDIVAGYLYSYPSRSRGDVRGKGNYDKEIHAWILEIGRPLKTGDPQHDVIFDPTSGKDYYFTIAVFDASSGGHWGSPPQILRFEPPRSEEESEE